MEHCIENIDFEVRFVGKSHPVKTSNAFKTIPKLWSTAKKDGFTQKLIDLSQENPKCKIASLAGICGKEVFITDEVFDYFMGVRYDGEMPEDMEELIIPPCLYVVFPNIGDAYKRWRSEWLPNSGYEPVRQPCIEHFPGPGQKPRHELWVPIMRVCK